MLGYPARDTVGPGFANPGSQSHSFMMDWLCFAKPFHHDGWALLRKTFLMMDWLGFAKPIYFDGIALLHKANPL